MVDDDFDLERFVLAQDGAYPDVVEQLRQGRKTGHWMWFVFPQLAGLGRSAMSRRYAVSGLAEARAYLAHPVLGPRLLECAGLVAAASARSAEEILGGIDAVKLHSSMTLFRLADPDIDPDIDVVGRVLDRWFAGQLDPATERLTR